MESEQVVLSDEVLAVMRGAVGYAVEYGVAFVAPAHLVLALLDDSTIGDVLRNTLERGRLIDAARTPAAARVDVVAEGVLPRNERAPFVRYGTVIFQSADGAHQRWLDVDSFRVFNEGARRVSTGRFLPRHLALGIAAEAQGDGEIRQLLGRDPELFRETAFALT